MHLNKEGKDDYAVCSFNCQVQLRFSWREWENEDVVGDVLHSFVWGALLFTFHSQIGHQRADRQGKAAWMFIPN